MEDELKNHAVVRSILLFQYDRVGFRLEPGFHVESLVRVVRVLVAWLSRGDLIRRVTFDEMFDLAKVEVRSRVTNVSDQQATALTFVTCWGFGHVCSARCLVFRARVRHV